MRILNKLPFLIKLNISENWLDDIEWFNLILGVGVFGGVGISKYLTTFIGNDIGINSIDKINAIIEGRGNHVNFTLSDLSLNGIWSDLTNHDYIVCIGEFIKAIFLSVQITHVNLSNLCLSSEYLCLTIIENLIIIPMLSASSVHLSIPSGTIYNYFHNLISEFAEYRIKRKRENMIRFGQKITNQLSLIKAKLNNRDILFKSHEKTPCRRRSFLSSGEEETFDQITRQVDSPILRIIIHRSEQYPFWVLSEERKNGSPCHICEKCVPVKFRIKITKDLFRATATLSKNAFIFLSFFEEGRREELSLIKEKTTNRKSTIFVNLGTTVLVPVDHDVCGFVVVNDCLYSMFEPSLFADYNSNIQFEINRMEYVDDIEFGDYPSPFFRQTMNMFSSRLALNEYAHAIDKNRIEYDKLHGFLNFCNFFKIHPDSYELPKIYFNKEEGEVGGGEIDRTFDSSYTDLCEKILTFHDFDMSVGDYFVDGIFVTWNSITSLYTRICRSNSSKSSNISSIVSFVYKFHDKAPRAECPIYNGRDILDLLSFVLVGKLIPLPKSCSTLASAEKYIMKKIESFRLHSVDEISFIKLLLVMSCCYTNNARDDNEKVYMMVHPTWQMICPKSDTEIIGGGIAAGCESYDVGSDEFLSCLQRFVLYCIGLYSR